MSINIYTSISQYKQIQQQQQNVRPIHVLLTIIHHNPHHYHKKNPVYRRPDQPRPEKKQLAFVDIKEDQKQCEKLLKMMETEISSFDIQVKLQYAKKVRQYKKDLDDCKKRLYRAEEDYALQKNKEMLMGAQLDQQKSTANKQKLLKQGQLLSDTNYKLKDSVKVMHQTLDLSNNIQIELTNQSQKMKSNKQNLIEMQGDIDSSYRKITNIMLRIRKNKFTLVGSIGVVLVIIVIALIVHFSKK